MLLRGSGAARVSEVYGLPGDCELPPVAAGSRTPRPQRGRRPGSSRPGPRRNEAEPAVRYQFGSRRTPPPSRRRSSERDPADARARPRSQAEKESRARRAFRRRAARSLRRPPDQAGATSIPLVTANRPRSISRANRFLTSAGHRIPRHMRSPNGYANLATAPVFDLTPQLTSPPCQAFDAPTARPTRSPSSPRSLASVPTPFGHLWWVGGVGTESVPFRQSASGIGWDGPSRVKSRVKSHPKNTYFAWDA